MRASVSPRRVAVVTTSRADYGLMRHTIASLVSDRRFDVRLVVSGTHLDTSFGGTISEIRADRTKVGATVPLPLRGDSGVDAAIAMGEAVKGFARAFKKLRPAVVVVLGDRYEMLAAAEAAALSGCVVAHIGGGEVSAGSLDEGWRHATTKIAHLHFVATRQARLRVRAMGEDTWRIAVVGAPGLDAIRHGRRIDRARLEEEIGHPLISPIAVCTYHPVTDREGETRRELAAMFEALRRSTLSTIVFTSPNADAGGRWALARIRAAVRHDRRAVFVPNLGSERYLSLLAVADVMVGNSSSGLIEAPSFRLPVVDVGHRQDDRLQARNVIDAPEPTDISHALRIALTPAFRRRLRGLRNPYGDGHAAERISAALRKMPAPAVLRRKSFSIS